MRSGFVKNITTMRRNIQHPDVIATMRRYWFDSEAVKDAVDAATARNLNYFGAWCMYEARKSIRSVPGPATKGEPPHSHKGQLKRFLFYKFDIPTSAVVIGPELLPGGQVLPDTVPQALERGRGSFGIHIRPGVGKVGPIAVTSYRGRRGNSKKMKTSQGSRYVRFARLKNTNQVRRSRDLSEEYGIYTPPKRGSIVAIAPHPYMAPAFAKTKAILPTIWYRSVRPTGRGRV